MSPMRVSLHIGPSPEATWQNVVLPWFQTTAARAFETGAPVAVITPFRSHAYSLRCKLLARGISLLGVRFLLPAQLRELLLQGSGANLALREHLRLLLAIAAEKFAAEQNEGKSDGAPAATSIAKSVARDPDQFLRALDRLGAAGWSFAEISPEALREIARRFENVARDCEFQFVYEADRAAVANAEKSEPRFSRLLISGFNGAHWPLWPLLRAAVSSAVQTVVVLSDPRDEARNLDEAWVGTWEETFGPAHLIDAIAGTRSTPSFADHLTRLPESAAEKKARAENPVEQIHFLVGRDTSGQAKAIVALTAKFLCHEDCERIGILFPRSGALPRLVANFLRSAKIAHNDGIAHLTPSLFNDEVWRSWLELQENPRLKALLRFLRAMPVKIFGRWSVLEVEKALRRAYADVLIDNIDILCEYLARQDSGAETIRGLAKIEFLPAAATLSQFLARTRKIFGQFGWRERWSEIERLGRNWTGCVTDLLPRRIYLRWLREILGAPSLARDEYGVHPYSRVHLLPYAEAEGQTWSHLIFAGLNEETWLFADDSGFIPEHDIEVLNRKVLNQRAVKRGRHGEGQWSVRENKTLLLGPVDHRQLILRQLLNLVESTTNRIGATANLYSDVFPSRISNPSELFARLYFAARGKGLGHETMYALERETRAWLKNWSPADAQKIDSISVGRTRLAFDARRQRRASGEYEFALRAPPEHEIALRVTDWEQALRWPALVWMKTFLGVEAEDENGDAWAVSTGQWVHRWLAQAAQVASLSGRCSPKDHRPAFRLVEPTVRREADATFVDIAQADQIRACIVDLARNFRSEVQNLCAACARPLPDWWMSGWNNALYLADCLAEKLSGLDDWSCFATEYPLGSPATIPLSANETLRVRGRVDLILARGERTSAAIGYPELWVVDYKTGRQRGFNLRELRRNQTPAEKLHKQLTDGRGVQLGLYALAVHALGASAVRMTLLSPIGDLEPQFSLEDVLAQRDFWRELHRMQETGVFGMLGKIFNEYGAVRTYPLATLAIDPDLLREKWEMTHPAFAIPNDIES